MGISVPGVGIHGTPASASVGYSLSHGCIRMSIRNAEWLYRHVRVGTPVWIF
jgi:lipoprotein-anchoring transpeptidase ErfK/SrfK